MINPVSSVEASFHERRIELVPALFATRLVGASGTVVGGGVTTTLFVVTFIADDVADPPAPVAVTQYEYVVPADRDVSVYVIVDALVVRTCAQVPETVLRHTANVDTFPPVSLQVIVALDVPFATAVSIVGVLGAGVGVGVGVGAGAETVVPVTLFEAEEFPPVPFAITSYVYDVPAVSPVLVNVVVPTLTDPTCE
jgi:hypothetical protein